MDQHKKYNTAIKTNHSKPDQPCVIINLKHPGYKGHITKQHIEDQGMIHDIGERKSVIMEGVKMRPTPERKVNDKRKQIIGIQQYVSVTLLQKKDKMVYKHDGRSTKDKPFYTMLILWGQ